MKKWIMMALAISIYTGSVQAAVPEAFSHGFFDCAAVYRPTDTVRGTVLILVDGSKLPAGAQCVADKPAAWGDKEHKLAKTLAKDGMLVAGIDIAGLLRDQVKGGRCFGFDGDLENFSRVLQARYQLPGYRPPVLIGSGTTAPLVYAQLSSAASGTYSGGVSVGFSPTLTASLPLCQGRALVTEPAAYDDKQPSVKGKPVAKPKSVTYTLKPATPLGVGWEVLPAAGVESDAAFKALSEGKTRVVVTEGVAGTPRENAAIEAAVDRLLPEKAEQHVAAPVADLPLVEVPASGPVKDHDVLAILLSGDGGWAGIDKDLAALLSKAGVPVIGFDSLRYFWKERTPESTTKDVERVIRYYQKQDQWKRKKVLLMGYSQGANVLPFVLNRMTDKVRSQLVGTILMGLGDTADFEFHVTNWLSASKDSLPIMPEIARMESGSATCIYGEKDKDSICPSLSGKQNAIKLIRLPGDHHFDGKYDRVVAKILEGM